MADAIAYTPALALALDNRRRIHYGDNCSLFVMDYAQPGTRGYYKLKEVTTGWFFQSGSEPEEPLRLEIAESETITSAILNKATVFGINGLIYKIVDTGRKSPTLASKRVWTFFVMPSGETVDP